MSEFHKRLNSAFADSGLSQAELGRRSNLSRMQVYNYLKGNYEPKQDKLIRIAKALHVNPDWLAGANVSKDGTEEVDFLTSDNLYLDKKQLTSDERQQMANFARGLRAASNIKNN